MFSSSPATLTPYYSVTMFISRIPFNSTRLIQMGVSEMKFVGVTKMVALRIHLNSRGKILSGLLRVTY